MENGLLFEKKRNRRKDKKSIDFGTEETEELKYKITLLVASNRVFNSLDNDDEEEKKL